MPNMEDVYSNVNQQYADAISDYYKLSNANTHGHARM